MRDFIKLIQPKPYEEVGIRFIIEGWIPKSWLDTGFGRLDNRVFLDFIDIEGQIFIGSSVDVIVDRDWLSKFRRKSRFRGVVQFNQFNAHFIIQSQGRITIKLSGHKEGHQLFVPIIVKSSNPNFKPDSEIIAKHGKIGEMVLQYEKDLKDCNRELEKIEKRRIEKGGLTEDEESLYRYGNILGVAGEILDILEKSEKSSAKNYPFTEEDLEEKRLKEKYKDAIKWRGPLLRGLVAKLDGYEFRVYSDDHDQHFHVIHREKNINARFSFPEIELVNYKNIENSISRKVRNEIAVFLKKPENFKKLEEEFQKRS